MDMHLMTHLRYLRLDREYSVDFNIIYWELKFDYCTCLPVTEDDNWLWSVIEDGLDERLAGLSRVQLKESAGGGRERMSRLHRNRRSFTSLPGSVVTVPSLARPLVMAHTHAPESLPLWCWCAGLVVWWSPMEAERDGARVAKTPSAGITDEFPA